MSPSAQNTQNGPQDRFALLLESTGEGIFGIDLDGHCTFINTAGARMLGHAADSVLGKNMHELTHHSHSDGRHYPVDDCPIFNAFRNALPCRIDTESFWRKDGSAFPVEYSSYPILDGPQVLGAVITFVDVTHRRTAELALLAAKSELEARVSERTAELSAALVQLQNLSAHTHGVREQERTRIAREVHDELGSLLVALKMDVNWLERRLPSQSSRHNELGDKCRKMSGLIETAVENVGRIITDLRPSIFDHQGLWAALEWQVAEFERTCEIVCVWQVGWSCESDAPAEPEENKGMAIFRIVQETFSNIARHSQASAVDVRVNVEGGRLHLSIKDNGQGAAYAKLWALNSFGMIGMRERARHFGGDIEVQSKEGFGCQISLDMPLL
jgi:PAS domain S-box-containing protein